MKKSPNNKKSNLRKEDLPVSDWVIQLAEGKPEYKRTPTRTQIKKDFYESRGKDNQ